MNNFYTLIYLNREIKEKICGGFFDFAISPHKNVLCFYIVKDEETSRLVFSANVKETTLFLDVYRPPKKRNVLNFFTILKDKKINDMQLADKDRLISILFEDDMRLLFKLFGRQPNVFLIKDEIIVDAFKNPDQFKGKSPPLPHAPDFKDEVSPARSAKNQMTECNPLLPRNLLPYIVKQHSVDEMGPQEVPVFTKKLTNALLEDPQPRVLTTGDLCLWSKEWLHIDNEKTRNKVNDCVAFAYKNAVHLRRLYDKKKDVVTLLERTVSKKEGLIKQLQQAEKSLLRADKYEKYGHLLMAHAHEHRPEGTKKITIDNFYENNQEITIPLKEHKDISGNAEHYYGKAKDARKSYKKAKQRLPDEKKECSQAKELLQEIKNIEHLPELERWLKDQKKILQTFGFGDSNNKQASSAYRKFKVNNFEIWIGKSAKSNDELTNRAHKEDIWLHARGVAGSHAVIRMGNRKEYPPQKVILRAAGYTAYYSKARGMKTAPVIYTKRKYVYKPKGAVPGAVVVKREKVEMVPPINPNQ